MSTTNTESRDFLSPQEFAAKSGISLVSVRRYIAAGRLPSVQPGGRRCRVLIPQSALAQFTKVADVALGTGQTVPKPTPLNTVAIVKKFAGADGPVAIPILVCVSIMPKKPKYELIRCNHFSWRLSRRDEVWYADGRSNPINVGRHSLGTRDKTEAFDLAHRLGRGVSREVRPHRKEDDSRLRSMNELSLAEGRRLYEEFIGRPTIVGGVKPTTKKRYGDAFNKFCRGPPLKA